MRLRPIAFPRIASLAALLAMGCSSPEPSQPTDASTADAADASADAAPSDPLHQVCPPLSLPNACDQCQQGTCCNTRSAFFAYPNAKAFLTCYGPKSCDDTCEAACFAKYPELTQAFLEHLACFSMRCGDVCAEPPRAFTPCESCTYDKCQKESLACSLSLDCTLFASCAENCTDQPCRAACATKYPNAATTANPLETCGLTRCAQECKNK